MRIHLGRLICYVSDTRLVFGLLLFYSIFLSLTSTIVPESIEGQQSSGFVRYTNIDSRVSILYPSDYQDLGPGSGWFAYFAPTQSSSSNLGIFLDYESSRGAFPSPMHEIITDYVRDLENTFSGFQMISQKPSSLGGVEAYSILYTYRNPVDNSLSAALDIVAQNYGGLYTLSFLGSNLDIAFNSDTINQIVDSFEFIEEEGFGSGPNLR